MDDEHDWGINLRRPPRKHQREAKVDSQARKIFKTLCNGGSRKRKKWKQGSYYKRNNEEKFPGLVGITNYFIQ